MTEGQGKKVASPPLRLGGRGKAGPGQIKPLKRPLSGGLPNERGALQTAGQELLAGEIHQPVTSIVRPTRYVEADGATTPLFHTRPCC